MRTRRAGNMTVHRERKENLFEFKQHRVYVTGPGRIHPKTGTPYGAEWRTIPAMPDVLLNRLCELYGAPKGSEAHAMSDETKRQTELLERFLSQYQVATVGEWVQQRKAVVSPHCVSLGVRARKPECRHVNVRRLYRGGRLRFRLQAPVRQ